MEPDLAQLIRSADEHDPVAADRLFSMLYHELHRLAEYHIGRAGGLTVGTTTLVHEAYLRVADQEGVSFPDRSRFLAYASRAMRGLVIDYARRRRAQKRGRELEITLHGDELDATELTPSEDWEQLGDALDQLASLDARLSEIVDLHFFCGFSFGEIAAMRDVSERTVQRDWRKARMFLQHAILETEEPPAGDNR